MTHNFSFKKDFWTALILWGGGGIDTPISDFDDIFPGFQGHGKSPHLCASSPACDELHRPISECDTYRLLRVSITLKSLCFPQVLDSVLLDLYRILKHAMGTEQDQTVLLHVQLALDDLDQIMKQYLFPQQTLTKRIHVVDPPP